MRDRTLTRGTGTQTNPLISQQHYSQFTPLQFCFVSGTNKNGEKVHFNDPTRVTTFEFFFEKIGR